MTELKTCPFCGGEARVYDISFSGFSWKVRCLDGCILMPRQQGIYFTSREQAVRAWNKRCPDEKVEQEIKIKYTVKRYNGYVFSHDFTIDQIENGEAKQWIEYNFVDRDTLTRTLKANK